MKEGKLTIKNFGFYWNFPNFVLAVSVIESEIFLGIFVSQHSRLFYEQIKVGKKTLVEFLVEIENKFVMLDNSVVNFKFLKIHGLF